jgi:hypothetical protein
MSQHFTCDRCGLPMESQQTLIVGYREYDLCKECQTRIYDGLKNGRTSYSHEEMLLRKMSRKEF